MRKAVLRTLLLALAVPAGAAGGWALFAPRSWYDSFPAGEGHTWIKALGPYNEHLSRDVGALFLATRGGPGAGIHAIETTKSDRPRRCPPPP